MTLYFLLFAFGLTFVVGDETMVSSQQNPGTFVDTKGFSIKNAYDLQALLDNKGIPAGSVQFYTGGRVGPGRPYYREQSVDPPFFQSSGGLFSNERGSLKIGAASFVAGLAFALIVWYSFSLFGGNKRLASFDKSNEIKEEKTKSRRRREIQHDEQLTSLASIVLSAVQSGECMQKSICLLGTQLGAGSSKSVLAATLLDKMLPEKVQTSMYYLTLQNALRGKANCDKIYCAY